LKLFCLSQKAPKRFSCLANHSPYLLFTQNFCL